MRVLQYNIFWLKPLFEFIGFYSFEAEKNSVGRYICDVNPTICQIQVSYFSDSDMSLIDDDVIKVLFSKSMSGASLNSLAHPL